MKFYPVDKDDEGQEPKLTFVPLTEEEQTDTTEATRLQSRGAAREDELASQPSFRTAGAGKRKPVEPPRPLMADFVDPRRPDNERAAPEGYPAPISAEGAKTLETAARAGIKAPEPKKGERLSAVGEGLREAEARTEREDQQRANDLWAGKTPQPGDRQYTADLQRLPKPKGPELSAPPVSAVDALTEYTRDTFGDGVAGAVRGSADAVLSAVKTLPQTSKLVNDIGRWLTLDLGDTTGLPLPFTKAYSDYMDRGVKALGQLQSYELRNASGQLQQRMVNPDVGVAGVTNFTLQNPGLLLDQALPSAGSMVVAGGTASAAGRMAVARAMERGLSPQLAQQLGANAAQRAAAISNALMNAGDTFAQTSGSLEARNSAALMSFLGTLGVNKLTGGGVEGQVGARLAGAGARSGGPIAENRVAATLEGAAKGAVREPVQEMGEQGVQDIAELSAEGRPLDPNALAKSVGLAGVAALPLGAGGGAFGETRAYEPAPDPRTPGQLIDETFRQQQQVVQRRRQLEDQAVAQAKTVEEVVNVAVNASQPNEAAATAVQNGAQVGQAVAAQQQAAELDQEAIKVQRDIDEYMAAGLSEPPAAGTPAPAAPAAGTPAAPSAIDAAAAEAATSPSNDKPEPTEAQKAAGNYPKGRTTVGPRGESMLLSIENEAGTSRRPEWPPLKDHYGYFRRTEGADGDQVDVFVKPGTPHDQGGTVYVVDQIDPKTGRFDEHKAILGATDEADARATYLRNYEPGWQGLGAVKAMPWAEFRQWALTGDTKAPVAWQPGQLSDDQLSNLFDEAAAEAKGGTNAQANPAEPAAPTGAPGTPSAPPAAGAGDGVAAAAGNQAESPAGPQSGATPGLPPADAQAGDRGGARVIGRLGKLAPQAQPVELLGNEDGTLTPHMNGEPLYDYDSGDPIRLPGDVSDAQARELIAKAGAIPPGAKFFTPKEGELADGEKKKAKGMEVLGQGVVRGDKLYTKHADGKWRVRDLGAELSAAKEVIAPPTIKALNEAWDKQEAEAKAPPPPPAPPPAGPSAQYESYRAAIEAGQGSVGLIEQIKLDERLEDGESEQLVALYEAQKPGANPVNATEVHPAAPAETFVCIACSDTKKEGGARPLIELYDGPMWQTLRTHRGAVPVQNIMVLSGKLGFAKATQSDPPYNERITAAKVDALLSLGFERVKLELPEAVRTGKVKLRNVIIAGSGEYRRAFNFAVAEMKKAGMLADDVRIVATEGGIGEQRGQLGQFLRQANGVESQPKPETAAAETAPASPQETEATHKDPGEPAEPVTGEVIREAVAKSAAKTPLNVAEAKKLLLQKIDAAIKRAKTSEQLGIVRDFSRTGVGEITKVGDQESKGRTNAAYREWLSDVIGYVKLEVPGDGTFSVLNTRENLQQFRERVDKSPGFRKQPKGGPPKLTGPTASPATTLRDMLEAGEYSNAVNLAEAAGIELVYGQGPEGRLPNVYTDAEDWTLGGVPVKVARGTSKTNAGWFVVEPSTGMSAGKGKTVEAAKKDATTNIERRGPNAMRDAVDRFTKSGKAKTQQQLRDELLAAAPEVEAKLDEQREEQEAREDADREAEQRGLDSLIPRGPFVQKTDAWVRLAVRRILLEAVEGGYDSVAFVTGQRADQRYDLTKQISSVRYEDATSGGVGRVNMGAPEGMGMLVAYAPNGDVVIDRMVEAKELPDYIGKEAAKKLLAQPAREGRTAGGLNARVRELVGEELKVGGEGMRAFYGNADGLITDADGATLLDDQGRPRVAIVPAVVRDMVKKLGGEVTTADFGETRAESSEYSLGAFRPEDARIVQRGNVFQVWVRNEAGVQVLRGGNHSTRELAEQYIQNMRPGQMAQMAVKITPAMREAILGRGGLPMFNLPARGPATPLPTIDAELVPDMAPADEVNAVAKLQRLMAASPSLKRPDMQLRAVPESDRRIQANTPQGRALRAAREFARRVLKVNVIYTEQTDGGDVVFNGVVHDEVPGVVFINVNADRPAWALFGHELLHRMRRDNPQVYDDLVRVLGPLLRPEYVEKMKALNAKRAKKGYSALGPDALFEEFIADVVGDRFTEPAFWREAAKVNPSRFRRVATAIVNYISEFMVRLRLIKPDVFDTTRYITDLNLARQAIAQALNRYATTERMAGTDEYQLPESFALSIPPGDPVLDEAMRKAGVPVERRSMAERVRDYVAQAWQNAKVNLTTADGFKQGVFDQFRAIKVLERRTLGNLPAEQSGYVAARLSTGTPSVLTAMLRDGAPEWRDGILQKVAGSKGLAEILEPVRDDFDEWIGWMVGKRANLLMQQGRENNLTQPEIDKLLDLAAGREPRFRQVAAEFAAYKRRVLDVAEGAGLIDATTRPMWDQVDWIPFYRAIPDEDRPKAPGSKRGLSGQSSGIRRLRGADEVINDPLENILLNFAHLIDASLKNKALLQTIDNLKGDTTILKKVGRDVEAVLVPRSEIEAALASQGVPATIIAGMGPQVFEGIQRMWSIVPPKDPDVVRVMRNGKPEWYRVMDLLLLRSLTAVNTDAYGDVMRTLVTPLRWFKRVLTRGVTAAPPFMLRNFIRDTVSTQMITRDRIVPIYDGMKGAYKSLTETGGGLDMMMAGASFIGGHFNANDPQAAADNVRRALRSKGWSTIRINQLLSTVVDTPAKMWELWERVGSAVENANREAVYEAARKAGKSKAQAVYEAKDLIDFSLRGDWAVIQFLGDVLPFFNARLQGLYKLGRATTDKGTSGPLGPDKMQLATHVAVRGAILMVMSLALAAMNSGEEWYEELEDWDRDTYWHFKVLGQHFRIPKPFELGVIFATIPERLQRYLMGQDDTRTFLKQMWWNVSEQLAMNPIPQMVRPGIEVFANRSMFTGRPIEGQADEGRLPSARYSERTSPTIRAAVDAAPRAFDFAGLSPKQIEYLVRGYFGDLGVYALTAADAATRLATNAPARPAWRDEDIPLLGTVLRDEPAYSSRWRTELYDMHRKVTEVARTIKAYEDQGRFDLADELEERNADRLDMQGELAQATRELSDIAKEMDDVLRDRTLTRGEKRLKLDELLREQNEIARETAKATRAPFRPL